MKLFKALSLALALAHIADSFTANEGLIRNFEPAKVVVVDSRAF